MAKLEPIDKISSDYVSAVRANWNGDLAFSATALSALQANEWDQIDVLEVVEDGSAINVKKDRPHVTEIELTHTCIAGYTLRVTLAYDPHLPYLLVEEVSPV